MNRENFNFEPLCETSEKGEKLFVETELNRIGLEIGERIIEAFRLLPDKEIAFRLKTDSETVRSFTGGERLPPAEILIAIHRLTGVSIDWILTGKTLKAAKVVKMFGVSKKPRLRAA